MKRLLCVLLISACVLVLGSCEILEKFISFERVETNASTNPAPTAPDANDSENKKPTDDKIDETTFDNNHSCTTPADDHENTTPDENITNPNPDDGTTPTDPGEGDSQIPEGNGETIVVEVKFQSGGIHGYHDKITVVTPTTFSHVLTLFAQMHEDISSYRLNFYLNGVRVDPNDSTFLKDGDFIYLEESGDGSGDVYPCIHTWVDGSCTLCGIACLHNEWDDNRQCLLCGTSLGVDFLQIEIYENGEPKYSDNSSIGTTVEVLLMNYYGLYPWDYWTASYEFYFNDVLITDGSYMITESGILNLVTRSYN